MTINQHYIPKFILNRFVDDPKNNRLRVFDKKKNCYLSGSCTPKKSMVTKLFYEHNDFYPNEIEDLLSKRETKYSPVVTKLINSIPISKNEFNILLEFRHVMYYRSNEFMAFHSYQKNRDDNSWAQRLDWRNINGISSSKDDTKKSQLKAIKRVIAGTDAILELSMMTPVCFVLHSHGKRFIIGDNGSLSMGSEFDGVVIIVLSPQYAIMFPRLLSAQKIMNELGLSQIEHKILYEEMNDQLVELVNSKTAELTYEYWVDPN